ncbi:putative hydro-lyase [Alteribacter natronophilus]|uniref:putative hydro-lyase n=1 Tax=Alteribacter natronophilus TaxID=2583810 RepID=UPI001AEE2F66|nr:putative hydro-lyase [Alteribacter natronophilus]
MRTPSRIRGEIRSGAWNTPTTGVCSDYLQTNLVVMPKIYAADFQEYAKLNPKPCPVLEQLPPGSWSPVLAPDADIRKDLPGYRVYRNGALTDRLTSIEELWQDDFVSFLIGCSFTFEDALVTEGVPLRHITENKNVAMYKTSIDTEPAGPFGGEMVVSMRPVRKDKVILAYEITGRFPKVHGAPVHAGDPERIGIADLNRPDYGEAVEVRHDEVPVFWACGVTPQEAILQARLPIVITHEPGHMFVTDKKYDEL